MERESFENEEIAKVINETVVPVKVDREERPDVDAIYMNACVAMTGQGGWPLNAFVTPELKPFFVGTYFPPDERFGRPGFVTVLRRIAEAWNTDRLGLTRQADVLHREFARITTQERGGTVRQDVLQCAVNDAKREYDSRFGGFGGAPKFPPDQRLALLLAAHADLGSTEALEIVTGTLDGMANGGIYDHVGGGFARYSVDAEWLVPHFEKMLYNQALLVPVFLDASLVTGSGLWQRVAGETLDWVLDRMRAPEGMFYCALDADSEGEEGVFYVWTREEMLAALGSEDGELACGYFGVTDNGNFENGTTVLNVAVPAEEFAARHSMTGEEWLGRLGRIKSRLLAARDGRVPPGTDDKCLTGWNGLMIGALARGWQVLGEPRYLHAARTAADFILARQRSAPGVLLRSFCGGESKIPGVLEDYAFLVSGLIDLYESCFELRYLVAARELADEMLSKFADREAGGFFMSDGEDKSLIHRTKEANDGALPAASAVAAMALLKLGVCFDAADFTAFAEKTIEASGSRAGMIPGAFASLVMAHRFHSGRTPEIVIAGDPADPEFRALAETAWRTYTPARVIAAALPGEDEALALARGRASDGKAAAYVCFQNTCQVPVHTPEELRALIISG
jgi:hypothetical protein